MRRGRRSAVQSQQITDRILAAAWALLLELGPDAFSIDRLAAVAQASKQTIYARFKGKPALLNALLQSRLKVVFDEVETFSLSGDVEDAFADYARRMVQSMVGPSSHILDHLIHWVDADRPPASSVRSTTYAELRHSIAKHFGEAASHWHFEMPDREFAAAVWLEAMIGHVWALQPLEREEVHWPARFSRWFLGAAMAQRPWSATPRAS